MMTLFLIGLGVIAALIGITLWVDMPPVDEFGCSLKGEGWILRNATNAEK
jgi:hypothetical protein